MKRVVIIGAGIVGVSTAIWLQRKGIDVVVVDKGGPASGTSFGNAGVLAAASVVPVTVPGLIGKAPKMLLDKDQPLFLNWSYLPRLLPWLPRYLSHCNPKQVNRIATALAPVLRDCLADHRALAQGTSAASFITAADYVYAYQSKKHFDADRFAWDTRRQHGFEWTEHDADSYQQYDPVFGDEVGYAACVHNHGRISDPGEYVRALASHIKSSGGEVVQAEFQDFVVRNKKISAVTISEAARNGAATESAIDCDAAVVATGVWSKALLKKLGLHIPMESERGYHIELFDPSVMPAMPTMIAAGKFVMTPMQGRLRLAGMVEFAGLKASANKQPLDFLRRYLSELIPDLTWGESKEWLGHRPAPSDSVPLIGELPGTKGVFVGFGHQHVGLSGGPKTGQLLSQLICGEPTGLDMEMYSPTRFR